MRHYTSTRIVRRSLLHDQCGLRKWRAMEGLKNQARPGAIGPPTALGNPAEGGISTFPQPRRRRKHMRPGVTNHSGRVQASFRAPNLLEQPSCHPWLYSVPESPYREKNSLTCPICLHRLTTVC